MANHPGTEEGERSCKSLLLHSHLLEGKRVQPSTEVKTKPGTQKITKPRHPTCPAGDVDLGSKMGAILLLGVG